MKATVIAVAVMMASGAVSAATTQQQIDDLRAGLHQVHLNTLSKYSESWGLEDRANIAALKKDQQRQDDHINAVQGAAQTANDRAGNLEVRADASEAAIRDTQNAAQIANDRAGNLEVRADATEGAIRETNAQMESDRQQSIDRDAVNAKAITAESQVRAEANVKLAAGISTAQSTGDYAVSRSDLALRNAAVNAQAIRSTNAKVAEHSRTLANHEQRLGKLESGVNRKFADIDKGMSELKKDANAAVAGVAAMSNIPQVTGGARFSAGVGVGQRGSEQAVAVGFSSQLTDSVIGKVSVANDSQQQWTVGAGLAVQW